MKKFIVTILAVSALFSGAGAFAASDVKTEIMYHFKPYGFIRNYAFFDTRATKALSEDIYFFIPQDRNIVLGNDVNAIPNFNYQAITTRLGLDILGYQIGDTKIVGKIEGDFYCLSSGGNVGVFRMRQSYVDLMWDGLGKNENTDLSLRIGQSWHPLAADMAHGINLETGAPFSPFNRSAQVMFNATFNKKVTLTAGILEQFQYRSAGPEGSSNKYQRRALIPEVYAGISYKDGGFLGRVGVSALTIMPRYGMSATGTKYTKRFTTVNPFVFLQYTKGMFQMKAKTVYAQSGEHMQLNSGYVIVTENPLKADEFYYTPYQSSVSFVSFQYGKKWQVLGMIGYQQNLGTTKAIAPSPLAVAETYFSGNGYVNIKNMFRVTPTILYNLGRMQFGLEYDFTDVHYGENKDAKTGLPTSNLHWVGNHRILLMAKFNL